MQRKFTFNLRILTRDYAIVLLGLLTRSPASGLVATSLVTTRLVASTLVTTRLVASTLVIAAVFRESNRRASTDGAADVAHATEVGGAAADGDA